MKQFPTFQGAGYFANIKRLRRDSLAFLLDAASRSPDLFRISFGLEQLFVINDPEAIREILIEQKDGFEVGWGSANVMATYLGRGILTTRGDRWKESRADLQAQLNQKQLDRCQPLIDRHVGRLLDQWAIAARQGAAVTATSDLLELTLRILCSALYDYEVEDGDAARYVEAIGVLQTDLFANRSEGVHFLRFLPTSRNRRLLKATRDLYALAEKIIDATPSDGVVKSRCPFHDWSRRNSASEIKAKEKVLSLLMAGPESVSNTLSWALLLLAKHPEFADPRLVPEIVQETLRLYPAGWAFERRCMRETSVQGFRIPKGATLVISPFLLHRNPRIWENALAFDPERFRAGRTTSVSKYGFIPFGAGHRSCIGSRLATMELETALEAIIKNFNLALASDPEVRPKGYFKLRPEADIKLTLRQKAK